MQPRVRARDEGGFTLLELIITIVLFGIMLSFAVAPYAHYRLRQQHVGTAREMVAFLRRAQVRAVSEAVTYRVDITSTGAAMFRKNGSVYQQVQTMTSASTRVTFTNAAFDASSGPGSSVYFYEKGSASKGSVTVARSGTSKVYTISVEGLTARVSYQ